MSLSGGKLGAYADSYTNHKQWEWTNRAGKVVKKALTSLAVYNLDKWSGVLTVVPRQQGGSTGTVTFESDAWLALLHGSEQPADPATLDLAHATSTITLCKPQASWSIKYGTERTTPSKNPEIKLPDEVTQFLGLKSLAPAERVVITAKGRPNCGARQIMI